MKSLVITTTALFFLTCCTRYRVETRTVPLPAESCLLPPTPEPLADVKFFKLKGDDGYFVVGLSERDFKVLAIFVKQLMARHDLVNKCPNVKIDPKLTEDVPVPTETKVTPRQHGQT